MSDSPRQRFQKTQHGKLWLDISVSPEFRSACDSAILQYGVQLGAPEEIYGAAANEFRRQGARDVLAILGNLATVDQPTEKKKRKGVDHGV